MLSVVSSESVANSKQAAESLGIVRKMKLSYKAVYDAQKYRTKAKMASADDPDKCLSCRSFTLPCFLKVCCTFSHNVLPIGPVQYFGSKIPFEQLIASQDMCTASLLGRMAGLA